MYSSAVHLPRRQGGRGHARHHARCHRQGYNPQWQNVFGAHLQRLKQRRRQFRDRDSADEHAEQRADSAADEADDRSFGQHVGHDGPAPATECADGRDGGTALGNGDAHRVVTEERRDDQRHRRGHQRQRAQDGKGAAGLRGAKARRGYHRAPRDRPGHI